MDYQSLGIKIREERIKTGMTQAMLAEKVNVTTAYIGQIERGERKLAVETLVDIADTLNLSVDYLLRENLMGNISPLISEVISILEKRDHKDIIVAIDVIKAMFDSIDKR